MTTRKYSSRSQQTTLTGVLSSSGTSATVVSGSSLMGGVTVAAGETFTVVIDPDTALEEIVDVTAVSTNTITITRAIDGLSGQAHSAGAVVRHMAIGRDYREANTHIEATTNVHGLISGAAVVGDTSTQTLTNKTLTSPTITGTGAIAGTFTGNVTGNVTGNASGNAGTVTNGVYTTDTGTVTSTMIANNTIVDADINTSAAIAKTKLALTGAIVSNDIANDTIVDADINTAAAIAKTKIAGTAVTLADTGTVTSTMITDGTIVDGDINASAAIARTKIANPTADVSNGGFKLTNLGTPTVSTDASTKAYVDTSISNLVGGAPTTLDTLAEIATALNNTANFSDTVVLKTGSTMSGALAMSNNKITGLATPTVSTDAATKGYIDTVTVAPSNLTGPITSIGSATAIASQTGTGTKFVVDTSPTLVTPVLGVATATSINGTTIPTTKTLVVTTDKLSTLAATTSAELAGVITDETGTGALVFGTSPTLSNPAINNFVLGYTTTVTAAGTTTLTNTSNNQQLFTGTTTQTVVLPVASTMTVGTRYLIENNSTGIVTIQSSGLNTIVALPSGMSVKVTSILASGTTAASWDYEYVGFNAITGTGSAVLATSPTITSPLINLALNAQTGTTYTLVAADSGKLVTSSNASAVVVTIPPSVFAVGEQINVASIGVGLTSFAQGAGVTITSTGATATAPILRARYSAATVICTASNTFLIVGDLA